MTQLAIATGVEISYSHVPRAVKRLKQEKLICEILVHVDTQPTGRRRRAYFLTEQGITTAQNLNSNLAEYRIKLRDEKGKISEMPLGKVSKYLETPEELFTLYKFIDQNNTFDLTLWNTERESIRKQKPSQLEKSTTQQAKEHIVHPRPDSSDILLAPEQYPVISEFQNRKDKIGKLRSAFKSKGAQIVLVTGAHGIGKSALVAASISIIEPQETDIYWCDVSGLRSLEDIILNIGKIFLDEERVNDFLYSKATTDPDIPKDPSFTRNEQLTRLLEVIIANFSDKRSILILDGLEVIDVPEVAIAEAFDTATGVKTAEDNANTQFDDLILKLFTIRTPSHLKLVITTRQNLHEKTISVISNQAMETKLSLVELNGLDLKYIKKLLGSGFDTVEVEALYQHTDGNPLMIKTISEIRKTKDSELRGLSSEDRAMTLSLMARNYMDK
ncbi:hypothetical protein [[Eubacterium] cellulosolvens]